MWRRTVVPVLFMALVLLVAFVLIGCQGGADAPETVPPAAPPMPQPLTLSATGIGGLDAATAFDADAVTEALAGYTVQQEVTSTEGMDYPILTVHDGETHLLTIHPDGDATGIYSVLVESPQVENSLGPRIGASYGSIYPDAGMASCEAGMEEMSGRVLCQAPGAANITYVFSGAWNGPDGEVPPEADLRNWALTLVAWHPVP